MAAKDSIKLKTVCLKIGSGATPRGGKEAYKGGATALIRSQNIYNDGFRKNGVVYIDDKQASELNNVEVLNGDVLLNITGDSVARCCQVGADILPARVNQHVAIIRPDPKTLDARYLHYILVSNKYQEQLLSLASAGATRPALTKLMIENLEVHLPHLAEQTRIAGILGALDDKIEHNRKMNETLEQMIRALFKSWFVDFDPVHAKTAGRQPAGMDKATADLFPDSFVDSELGMIPKGWNAGTLSELSEFSRESINPGESPSEIFDHYSLPSFDEGKAPKAEAGSEIKSNKLVVTKKCVLLSKLNPHIPRIWLPDLSASRRSICSTEFIVASALTSCTREYLYALFISEDFSRTYGTLVTGTTGSHQRIRPESVLQMKLPVAPKKLISSFTDLIAPMLDRVACNTKESQTLAELRNSFLPVLISGGQLSPA
jgi:type I restriction enzyme S subunit